MTSVISTLTRPPATPAKVTRAFWPGTVVATFVVEPRAPAAVASAGTSWRRSVAFPVSAPCGSTTIVYAPVSGSATASRKPPFVPTVVVASVRPSGRRRVTFVLQQTDVPTVTSEISRLTMPPTAPAKLAVAFWPGAVEPTVTGAPPRVIAAVVSGGTACSVRVASPTFVLCGSTTIEYVPLRGRLTASIKPPFVPRVKVETVLLSGRRMVTFVLQQTDVPMVTSVISRLTRSPAVASNVSVAMSPATGRLTVTGAPPGTMGAAIAGAAATRRPAPRRRGRSAP